MTIKDDIKKQIIYRSSHRGTKEMDILFGNFVKRHINDLNINDLKDLQKIILIEDEILYKWYFNKIDNSLIPNNAVSIMLRSFKL